MPTRYDDRRRVCVPIAEAVARYGWLTNITAGDSTALGHTELSEDGSGGTGVVFFGASRPKPPRARKSSDGTTSFYDASKALPAGWVKSSPSKGFIAPRTSDKTTRHFVSIQGAKYAWDLPNDVAAKIGAAKEGLGVQVLSNGDNAWFGVNMITNTTIGKLGKPIRAIATMTGEGG